MATRSTAHAGEEKAIFDAFVAAHPSFGAQIKNVEQPDAEFPDVIVELKSGTFIDVELGEWVGRGPDGGCEAVRRPRQGNDRHARPAGYKPVAPCPGGDAHSPRGCRNLIRRRSGRFPRADLGACQRHRPPVVGGTLLALATGADLPGVRWISA